MFGGNSPLRVKTFYFIILFTPHKMFSGLSWPSGLKDVEEYRNIGMRELHKHTKKETMCSDKYQAKK